MSNVIFVTAAAAAVVLEPDSQEHKKQRSCGTGGGVAVVKVMRASAVAMQTLILNLLILLRLTGAAEWDTAGGN